MSAEQTCRRLSYPCFRRCSPRAWYWQPEASWLSKALRLAGPLLINLAAQTVLAAAWATWVTSPLVGRDYESANISGAFCGFAIGTTATAIANMQALTRRHGTLPQAFVIVPIVGAFFIDLINLAVLTFYLCPGYHWPISEVETQARHRISARPTSARTRSPSRPGSLSSGRSMSL
jgi:hypothetical protein